MMRLRRCRYFSFLLCICLLAGCGFSVNNSNMSSGSQREDFHPDSLGLEPEFTYEVPLSVPGILVNQEGYIPGGKKTAIFRGKKIPDSFSLIDEKTGEAVFSGIVEDIEYNVAAGEYNGYGIFSEWKKEGDYYIQAPILGCSYPFSIEKNIYSRVLEQACKKYYVNRCGVALAEELAGESARSACHTQNAIFSEDVGTQIDAGGGWHTDKNYLRSVEKGSQVMANLLLAYELYPEAFSDASGIPESSNGIPDILDEVRYGTDWMFKMQDKVSGGVYKEAVTGEQSAAAYSAKQEVYIEPISLDATAAFAGAMAKFGYVFREYDAEYARQCIQAADSAWRFLEKNSDGQELEQRVWAAAELYRATGYQKYRNETEEYLSADICGEIRKDYYFWASITYISTKRYVNVTLCADIMKVLMDEAEEISEEARQSVYWTGGNKEQDNNDELLDKMTRLTVVDHIIANHEYETIIENHMNYFMGCNPKAVSYIDSLQNNESSEHNKSSGIMDSFDLNAEFIFVMSELVSWYKDLEQ